MKFTVSINEEKRTIEVKLPSGIKGKAKCMLTDPFSYDVGITLALERARVAEKASLQPTKPITTKAEKPFKVGERVRFKSWKRMCNEFSVDINGFIVFPNEEYFTIGMKELCGTYATITHINKDGYIVLTKMSAGSHWINEYAYTLDMIEHIN